MTIGMALVIIVAIITAGIVIVKIAMIANQFFSVDCSNDMHYFEDMYDTITGSPTLKRASGVADIDMESVIEASKPVSRVYVKSICKHCGKTIKR